MVGQHSCHKKISAMAWGMLHAGKFFLPSILISLSPFWRPFSTWTWVSRCLLKQRMMEVMVTTAAIRRVTSSSQIITTNKPTPSFLLAGCPSCRPTNSVEALKGKWHIPWTCSPQAHLGVFQLCLWPLISPGYLGGGLPCLSSALWCQYPTSHLFWSLHII